MSQSKDYEPPAITKEAVDLQEPVTMERLIRAVKEYDNTKMLLHSIQSDASVYAEQNRALKVIAKRALHFIQDIQAGKEEDAAKSRSKLGSSILAFQEKYGVNFAEVQEPEDGT